jgi:ribosome recycling factor
MKHTDSQQLQAIRFCRRFLLNAIKPSKKEREFIEDVLATIEARIEKAQEARLSDDR